jgi:O-antigen ligase
MNNWLVMIIVVGLPSYLVRFNIFGIPTTLLEILIYISALFFIISSYRQKIKINLGLYKIPIVLLILSGLISTYISPDKMQALGLFKAYLIDPIIIYLIIINTKKINKNNIIYCIALSGLLVGMHSFVQYFNHQTSDDGRVLGVFNSSPNYLALYLAPIVVLGVIQVIKNIKNKILYFWLVVSFFTMFGVYVSGSRAGFISVIAGLILFLGFRYYQKKEKMRILLLVLSILFITISGMIGWTFFEPNFSPEAKDRRVATSNNLRVMIWQTTFEIIKQKPIFGVGLGNYQNYFTEFTKNRVNYPEYVSPMALTPHNIFLTFWVNLGILGLSAFVWILCIFINANWQRKNYLLLSIMLSIVIFGFVDTPYWKNDLALIFWLLIAVT